MAKSLSLIVKIFASLAAAAGIGGGGWYIYDETNPTLNKKLTRMGYVWRPASAKNINIQDSYNIHDLGKSMENLLSPKDCSKNFFPGIPNLSNGAAIVGSFQPETNKTLIPIVVPTISLSENSKGIGCLVFKVGQNANEEYSEAAINWEIALQKGNHGLIILGFSTKSILKKDSSEEFTWMLVHLRYSSEKWNIVTGVIWDETNAASGSASTQEIKIHLPKKNSYVLKLDSKKCIVSEDFQKSLVSTPVPICKGPNYWKYWEVSGFWEESKDNKGQEIFEVVEWGFPSSGQDQPGDTWGKKEFSFEATSSEGWCSIYRLWEQDRWKELQENSSDQIQQKQFNANDYLKAVYAPFARKKGIWTEVDEFCKDIGYRRGTKDPYLMNKVKSLCMTKK